MAVMELNRQRRQQTVIFQFPLRVHHRTLKLAVRRSQAAIRLQSATHSLFLAYHPHSSRLTSSRRSLSSTTRIRPNAPSLPPHLFLHTPTAHFLLNSHTLWLSWTLRGRKKMIFISNSPVLLCLTLRNLPPFPPPHTRTVHLYKRTAAFIHTATLLEDHYQRSTCHQPRPALLLPTIALLPPSALRSLLNSLLRRHSTWAKLRLGMAILASLPCQSTIARSILHQRLTCPTQGPSQPQHHLTNEQKSRTSTLLLPALSSPPMSIDLGVTILVVRYHQTRSTIRLHRQQWPRYKRFQNIIRSPSFLRHLTSQQPPSTPQAWFFRRTTRMRACTTPPQLQPRRIGS